MGALPGRRHHPARDRHLRGGRRLRPVPRPRRLRPLRPRHRHGHLWDPKNGKVSTHYVDAAGGWSGTHVGGAIDAGFDPPSGAGISDYEKVRLDDLVADLDKLGWGCIWGVPQHYDHAHIDYIRANRNIVYQGPNAGFRVAEIEAVQRAAKALGVYTGDVDGVRGIGTQAAIKTLQQLAGLTADALPGAATMAAINSLLALNAGFTIPDIRARQSDLRRLGYYKGALDGLRGGQTVAAIEAFQRDRGLAPDGLPGRKTVDAITLALAELDKPAPRPEPTPPPVVSPEPPTNVPPVPGRLGGADRYDTAALVARQAPAERRQKVYLAADWADGLAAASAGDGVVLLARRGGTVLPGTTQAALRDLPVTELVIVGGTAAIPEPQARQAVDAITTK
ncbi:peptidoglycan-binding protein [Ornithinimicrobium avium]|uniref:peptidoglycan-binding protein n=1 Tax=Ornithinimicrobium avium TaxID=2283195 RepID=UPI0013B36ABF|nr:peptidoglycan-binding protein [Ornithinimicrobium avium]